MTPEQQLRAARRLGAAAAVVALLSAAALLADHVVALRGAPAGKGRVQALEANVKTDASVSAALHEERKQQTDSSLGRDARGRQLAWVLVVAAAAFVAAGTWQHSLRPQPLPALDELLAARLPAAAAHLAAVKAPQAEAIDPASDLAFVDELVLRFGRGPEAAIPILQAIQERYRYLPDEALRRVCERTAITPAQLAGSSTFYARFRHQPVGRHVVRVCHGTACHVAGAAQISQDLRRHLGIPEGADTDPRRLFTLDEVACVGFCSLAPVIVIEQETAGRVTPAAARAAVDAVAGRA